MNQTLLHHVAVQSLKKTTPKIETGMSVIVSQKIKEGEKERIQNFEGLVISTNGGTGINATFTVRKIVGGIGVEKVFPLHSQNVTKIKVLKQAKIRRSKLYYMRELRGKSARMSETHIQEVIHDSEAEKKEAEVAKKKEEEKVEAKEEAKVEEASTTPPTSNPQSDDGDDVKKDEKKEEAKEEVKQEEAKAEEKEEKKE